MQHTHARWEQVHDVDEDSHMTNGVSELTNGVNGVHINGNHPKPTHSNTIFPPVKSIVSRNFLVVDTVFESPPCTGLGIPGLDGDTLDVGPNGLPDIDEDLLSELPPECRQAFTEAKEREMEWKTRWASEAESGARGNLKIGFLGFPV